MPAGIVKHVYFGPKDANGEMLPEPTYEFKPYPKLLYGMIKGEMQNITVDNEQQHKEAEGWVESPAMLGIETAPSAETARAALSRFVKPDPLPGEEKRGPGRPKAA